MSTPNWSVEDALNEVAKAIRDGARPLAVEADVEDGFKTRYRPDFTTQYQTGADWTQARDRVLPLATAVGALATQMTLIKAVLQLKKIPVSVDADSAYLAGYLVAQSKICPPRSMGSAARSRLRSREYPFGDFCTHFPHGLEIGEPSMGKMVEAARTLFAELKNI